MIKRMSNGIKIVIGSWGSYNECNERALGSKWLDLAYYDDWDEIVGELKTEGFELDGIDEELFVQDIEGIPSETMNWDYCNPRDLFETLKESGVLYDDYQYKVFQAFLEVRNWDDFKGLVMFHGVRWNEDIYLYENYDWEDYGRKMFESCGYTVPEILEDFIDFEAYGKYIGNYYAQDCSYGIIEIR